MGIFHGNLFMMGPDLVSDPAIWDMDECGWLMIKETIKRSKMPPAFADWKIPGEPKHILSYSGTKIGGSYSLFELQNDSGPVPRSFSYPECLIYSHALSTVLVEKNSFFTMNSRPERAGFITSLFGTGRLCVKEKVGKAIKTSASPAIFSGRKNANGGFDTYFEMDELAIHHEGLRALPAAVHLRPSHRISENADPEYAYGNQPGMPHEISEPGLLVPGEGGDTESPKKPYTGERLRCLNRVHCEGDRNRFLWILD
jgi:hypothetical protein